MKKNIIALLLFVTIGGGFLFLSTKKNNYQKQTKTAITSETADNSAIKFNIFDANGKELGRTIKLSTVNSNEIRFIFDYLPNDDYTSLFWEDKQVQQATKATKLEYGYYLKEDANSVALKKGSHKITVKIFKTKTDAKKGNVLKEYHYTYAIQK